jgi:alkylated DNA repair dioxygenase AlkB
MTTINFPNNSWIIYGDIPNSIKYDFGDLWNLHPENYGNVIIYGKKLETPRYQQSFLIPYYFSGLTHDAIDLPSEFKKFMDWSNSLEIISNFKFNQALVNWYANGHHYINAHSDSTIQLIKDSPIMSISLGEKRKFRIRDKENKKIVLDFEMKDRTYIIMGGEIQTFYTHEVPKINGIKGENTGKRINITFRMFKQ